MPKCGEGRRHWLATGLFLFAGAAKLVDPYPAAIALSDVLEFADLGRARQFILALASLELALGIGLAHRNTRPAAQRVGLGVTAILVVWLVLDAGIRGLHGCGCFGPLRWLNSFPARVTSIAMILIALIPSRYLGVSLERVCTRLAHCGDGACARERGTDIAERESKK